MSIQTSVNYNGTFKWATAGSDPYDRQYQLQGLASTFEAHNHDNAGKGLPVSLVTLTGILSEGMGASIAAANNLTLGTDGNSFHITGATQINLINTTGVTSGVVIRLIFDSNPVIKHSFAASGSNKPIMLRDAVDFTAVAGVSVLTLVYDGPSSRWEEVPNHLPRTAIQFTSTSDYGKKFQTVDSASSNTATAAGNVFDDGGASTSWPSTFSGTPKAFACALTAESGRGWAGSENASTSTTVVQFLKYSDVNTTNVILRYWGLG